MGLRTLSPGTKTAAPSRQPTTTTAAPSETSRRVGTSQVTSAQGMGIPGSGSGSRAPAAQMVTAQVARATNAAPARRTRRRGGVTGALETCAGGSPMCPSPPEVGKRGAGSPRPSPGDVGPGPAGRCPGPFLDPRSGSPATVMVTPHRTCPAHDRLAYPRGVRVWSGVATWPLPAKPPDHRPTDLDIPRRLHETREQR